MSGEWSGPGLGTNMCEIRRSAVLVVTAARGEAHAAGESQTRSSAVMRIGQREVPKQDEPMTFGPRETPKRSRVEHGKKTPVGSVRVVMGFEVRG